MLSASVEAAAQSTDSRCWPMAQRTAEVGCWIIVDDMIGRLPQDSIFWHLDAYPSQVAANAAKGVRSTIVESLGKVWLFTIAKRGWRARNGDHVAEIGPLPARQGVPYSAMYMEAIFTPGMDSLVHTHSGPEAWYTAAGETCLETPNGVMRGRAGGPPIIIPAGPPMYLVATGHITRRAIVLILHDSSQPATTVTHDWTPKGLCKNQ
jgi:quercetin dioxygenase-like cupin family protein